MDRAAVSDYNTSICKKRPQNLNTSTFFSFYCGEYFDMTGNRQNL